MITLERKKEILDKLLHNLNIAEKKDHCLFLCIKAERMEFEQEITKNELKWLLNLIEDNRPEGKLKKDAYWSGIDYKSRRQFINKLISELK